MVRPCAAHACQSRASLHDDAFAPIRRLTRILAAFHLSNDQLERLLHILVVSGAGLSPRALELFGEGFSVFGRNLALLGAQVGFVAYDDNGDPVDCLCYKVVRGSACCSRRAQR